MSYYVATDLHGQYDLWKALQNYLKEDDTLIFLGDAIDRGDRGWEILTEMLDDPRVIFLKGNHEDLMYNSYRTTGPAATEWLQDWKKNGGQATINNMKEKKVSEETKQKYLDKIADLPYFCYVENSKGKTYFLSHAGFTPDKDLFDINKLKDMDNDLYYAQQWKLLWDRKHIFDEWPDEQEFDNIYIIHGHTSIYACKRAEEFIDDILGYVPFEYVNGHKINLDLGNDTLLVFNLNKEEVISFEMP